MSDLIRTYRAMRQRFPYMGAATALIRARADIQQGARAYPSPALSPSRLTRASNPYAPKAASRYCSNLAEIGARLVGYSDEILDRLRHKGWFANLHFETTYRGVVVQFSGRSGKSRVTHGYQESDNGGFIIDLTSLESVESCDYRRGSLDIRNHAISGDSMAENAAQESIEYDQAAQSGFKYAELGDSIITARGEALEILAERKGLESLNKPALCAAIRAQVQSLLSDIRDARQKRSELKDSVWSKYHGAFNDGASESVFKLA